MDECFEETLFHHHVHPPASRGFVVTAKNSGSPPKALPKISLVADSPLNKSFYLAKMRTFDKSRSPGGRGLPV